MIFSVITQEGLKISTLNNTIYQFSDNLTFQFVRDPKFNDYTLAAYINYSDKVYSLEIKNEDTFEIDSRFLNEKKEFLLSFSLTNGEEIIHLGTINYRVKDAFGSTTSPLPGQKEVWTVLVEQEVDDYFLKNYQSQLDDFNQKYEEIKKIASSGGGSGSNVTVDNVLSSTSTNPVQNKVIKSELDKKASTDVATTSANGLMSKDDKVKMDSIATGANKTVVDSILSDTSTNPIQNQAVAKELAEKLSKNGLKTINGQSLVGSGNIELSAGDNDYELPIANNETLGGVKPVAKTDEMTQEVGVDEAGGLFTKEGDGIDEETLNQINRNTEDISKLSDEIDDLKENGLNQNIDEAVANYLSENPISGGLTSTAKNLLITILRNSLYSNNQSENITALETALGKVVDTTVYYSITNTLTNVTNNNSNTQVLENTTYIASLSANNGYTLESITVTMGGIDITSSVYADGVITVSNVTGDIIITANAIISTTSNDELITDGLLAYVDGRTCTYNNSNSNGATTIIPNQGSGQFFAWAKDGVEVQDEYGLHFASSRDHMYDKDGGTNESDLGTQFTVVHLTKGHAGFGSAFKNLAPYWMFKPYYITTSGSRMDITDSSSYNGDSKDDYNFMVYRVDGTKLTQIMDTSRVDRDGSTIDGFASWNAKVGLGMQMQNADGMYVTAFAVYNRALSDVEIEEMRAFFKTLEVSA